MKKAAKRAAQALFFCALAAGLSSCRSLVLSGLTVPLNETHGTVIGEFDIEVPVRHFAAVPGGGVPLFNNRLGDDADAVILEAIKAEVGNAGGSAAINVVVTWGRGIQDLVLSFLTGGIYSPATVRVIGQIIK